MSAVRPHRPFPCREPGFPGSGQRFALGRLLAREPLYARLWRLTHDVEALAEAGFFDDGLDRQQARELGLLDGFAAARCRWFTPQPEPAQLPDQDEVSPCIVLLSTGAFAPVHEGHCQMLDIAEAALRAAGLSVCASYLSPSHDLYVSAKDGGRAAAYPASLRIHLAQEALFAHPSPHGVPRLVDPWESMGAPRPVNFTTVMAHLEAYLSCQWRRPVRVVYVFGADNAGFCEVFSHGPSDGLPRAVCVGRPGSPLPQAPNVLCVPAHNAMSSTQVRRQHAPPLSPAPAGGIYLLRDEGEFAWRHWQGKAGSVALAAAWNRFGARIQHILATTYENVPGHARPDAFRRLPLAPQRRRVERMAKHAPLISLDACTDDLPGVFSWPSSRRFRLCDHQQHAHGRGLRPGASWPGALPAHAWLVDDDSATGASVAQARADLHARGVRIDREVFLLHGQEERVFDVVDLRDFLPGAHAGGLVVEDSLGRLYRVPYMAPFTNLHTRARLPPGTAWLASVRLWEAAAEFFASLPRVLTVDDMDGPQRAAFLAQGYAPSFALTRLCAQMASDLSVNACPASPGPRAGQSVLSGRSA